MAFKDILDGSYLDRISMADDQENQAWLRQRIGRIPAPAAAPPAPEAVDGWWEEFLRTTTADVGKVLLSGVTFGIVQPKHLGTLGTIIEKYATPEERKGAIRRIAEFGGELLAGAVVGGPLLGPLGRAAAGILPKTAGTVAKAAVRAGAEGTAIGAAQAGVDVARGEATPLSVLLQVGGGAALGGTFGAALGRITSTFEKRAAARLMQTQTRQAEALSAESGALDDYEQAVIKWAKELEVIEPKKAGAVSTEAEATSVFPKPIPMGEGETRTPIPAKSIPIEAGPVREPVAALPAAPEAPAATVVDPRVLLKKADALEASLEGKSQRYKDTMRPVIEDLRARAMAAQVSDVAADAVEEATRQAEWPKWRKAIIAQSKGVLTGKPKGEVESGLAATMAQAMAGGLVGAPLGAATAEKPEDRLQNAVAGALVGAVTVPALAKFLTGAVTRRLSQAAVKPAEAAVGEVAAQPKPQAKIRVEPLGTPEAEKLQAELAGQTQQAGGFVFHVPWAERASRQDLAQSVSALAKTLEQRVGSARIGPVSDEVLNAVASKFELGDLLSKKLGEGWSRFEAAALGMHMRAADDEFWRLLKAAKTAPEFDEFKRAAGTLLSLTRSLFGATSEWGYTGHVWQQVQEATPAARNSVRLLSQLLGVDATEAQLKLGVSPKRFHEMMLAMAEQKGRSDRMIGWAQFAKNIESGLVEAWINGLLSNPATHAANLLGNIGPVFAGPAERFLAGKFSSGVVGSVVPGEGMEMLYGLWGGFGDAFKAASKSFRSGISAWDVLATKIEMPRQAISAEALGLSEGTALAKGVDLLGTVIRTPGRMLTAADDFFKMLNYRMELHALTYRAAKIAHPEGGEAFTRALASLRSDPTTEILEQAIKFSEVQTFTNPLGDFGNALQRLSNSHPSVKLILPFIRTPINLVKYAWERAPGLNMLNSQVRADFMQGGAARDLVLAKTALGAMIGATASVLAAGGLITGRGPSEPSLKQGLELTGWQPYSIKIGDTYYAFSRLDPIGMTLGAIADFADLAGHMDEATLTNTAQALVLSMIRNVTSKTWMQGTANVLEALTDQDGRYLNTFFNLQGRSLVPAFLGQVTRSYVDPEIHEVHSVLEAIRSRVPGFSSALPPRRNLWGDPVLLEGGLGPDIASPIYTRKIAGDKVAEEIAAQRIRLHLPPDFIGGAHPSENITAEQRVSQGVPLTPQQRDRWIVMMGKEIRDSTGRNLKESLAHLMETPQYRKATGGPDGMRAYYVQQTVEYFRELAQQRLLQEMPDLSAAVSERMGARRQARMGVGL